MRILIRSAPPASIISALPNTTCCLRGPVHGPVARLDSTLAARGRLCKRMRVPYSAVITDGAPALQSERYLHQNDSPTSRRTTRQRANRVCCAVLVGFLAAGAARAGEQPTAAMMEPVQGLVTFMSTLRRGEQPTVFGRRGLCIVENF